MDKLIIKELAVNTTIGVHAWEQCIKQRLLIDITIPGNFSECQDDIARTVDYDALCQKVTKHVESQSYQLIETVGSQVAALIQSEFKVNDLTVSVTKPHAVKNAAVIRIEVEV